MNLIASARLTGARSQQVFDTLLRTLAEPGAAIEYTITVINHGPAEVVGAQVTDLLDTRLLDASWRCFSPDGGQCTAGPVSKQWNSTYPSPNARTKVVR